MWAAAADGTNAMVPAIAATATGSTNFAAGGDVTGAVLAINQPAGGVGQFKGLARADKYNEVVCKGVV